MKKSDVIEELESIKYIYTHTKVKKELRLMNCEIKALNTAIMVIGRCPDDIFNLCLKQMEETNKDNWFDEMEESEAEKDYEEWVESLNKGETE